MIDEAIVNAKKEHIASLSQECEIPLEELNKIVLPIIDSCTKDAISVGFVVLQPFANFLSLRLIIITKVFNLCKIMQNYGSEAWLVSD